MKLQKIGGYGSIVSAFLCAICLVIFLLVVPRLGLVGPRDLIDPVISPCTTSLSLKYLFLEFFILVF